MAKIEEIYKKWRWSIYNEVDVSNLDFMLKYPNYYPDIEKISDNMNFKNYTTEIFNNFQNKNFEVSKKQIEVYDKKLKERVEHFFSMHGNHYYTPFRRSVFIEKCFLLAHQYERHDLIEKIKTNLIYFQWWDFMTFDVLCESVIRFHFLKSTQKLIDYQALFSYIIKRFHSKEDCISYLLKNFIPSEDAINRMNCDHAGDAIFDYLWLFGNEFKKSIRIFENECRLNFNEKIIGAFFNEDLLFRVIKRDYGDKFNIVSQGSPEWLTPQRFDIYFQDLNIAIEYQGEQHFRPVDFGGKGEKIAKKQFDENLKRDFEKKEKSKINNCALIYVNPDYDIQNVLNSLDSEIKKRR